MAVGWQEWTDGAVRVDVLMVWKDLLGNYWLDDLDSWMAGVMAVEHSKGISGVQMLDVH